EVGRRQLEAFSETLKQFWDAAGEIGQVWLDQVESELALTSEFFGRFSSVRSAPDAAAVYQEFTTRHLQIVSDSNRRLFKDGESLLRANTRLFSFKGGSS